MGAVAADAFATVAVAPAAIVAVAVLDALGRATRAWARTGGRVFPAMPAVVLDAGAAPPGAAFSV
jgi:hypothetical protein